MRNIGSYPEQHTPKRRGHHLILATVPLMVLMALALVACDEAIEHPDGPTELVLRVEAGGGFVPVEYDLTRTPYFSLYGDGTVIVTGPMIEIYPQPALPNLQQTTITQDDIDKLLSAAREAGLFTNGVDYGTPGVADLPTTTITINADGQSYASNIYALGFEQPWEDMPISGLTSEQAAARSKVLDLTSKTGDLDTFLATQLEWQRYDFTSLSVYSVVAWPASHVPAPAVSPNHLDWPLEDLSTAGEAIRPERFRRVVVAGEDLTEIRPLLDQATQITLWKSGDAEYYLLLRPLLPDEDE